MVLGDAASKLQMFIWIFNNVLKSATWSLFGLKASNLDRWPISMLSFMWCYQFIEWFKFETRPSSLRNSGMEWRELLRYVKKNRVYADGFIAQDKEIFQKCAKRLKISMVIKLLVSRTWPSRTTVQHPKGSFFPWASPVPHLQG